MTLRIDNLITDLTDRLSAANDREGQRLVAELRTELEQPGCLWPDSVMSLVAELVSPSVWNPESRTYKSLDKRIQHAMAAWRGRYGPLTLAQEDYMAELLCYGVNRAVREAAGDKRKLYAYMQNGISMLVNDEKVHQGFLRRGPKLVDVTSILAGVVAA